MNRLPRPLRAFWFAYAILQLVLPGVASIADARLEAASVRARPTSHIEEHGSPECARVHPADCAFCRVLSGTATPPSVGRTPAIMRRYVATPSSRTLRPVDAAQQAARARDPPADA